MFMRGQYLNRLGLGLGLGLGLTLVSIWTGVEK